ncbi:AAA family ATPase [Streptomyces sp. DH24]|uniref:AAA family ATPase n=1 Tax=Streptomyces sp. DH24 TaxID=3040123 RepID=UPI0024431ADD|nr:LuxR family transcriptional regulator [Streptomyces sp. DH24]MDG9715503.1 AAA family ATPase [Streptomyces sp. DH24]
MLLEREQELTVLDKAVAEAQSGSGALVLVDGGAGTGTTALLHRLADLAAASGALVLRSAGAFGERAVPFGVVRQLVLPLLAEPGVHIPSLAGPLLAPGCDPGPGPDRGHAAAHPSLPAPGETPRTLDGAPCAPDIAPADLADALHWLHIALAGISAERTVVLAVDDLGWVDDASRHALAHLAARLEGMRVLMAVVRKDGLSARDPLVRDIAATATHHVRARALSRRATGRLVADRLGPHCPEEFTATCHEVTGGRPKDLRTLCDRARLRRLGAPAWHTARLTELGESLRRERLLVLLRREPVVEAFAKATAVLGDQATDDLVARLAGLTQEQCDHARDILARTWPGTDDDPASAVRAVAGVVLGAMGDEESSHRHRQASVLLDECGADPEEVVAPLLHVDRLGGAWEIHQLRAAAAAARRRGAPDAAVRYLSRALVDVPAGGGARAELLFELGVTEAESGSPSAVRHLVQAARLMPRIRRRAEVVSSTPMHIVGSDPQLADLIRETAAGLGTPREADRHGRYLAMRLEARARYAGLHEPRYVASAPRRLRELGERHTGPSSSERELRIVLLFSAAMGGQAVHRDIARMARQVLEQEPAHAALPGPALDMLPPVLYAVDAPHAAASWLDAARLHAAREGAPGLMARVEAQRGLLLVARGEIALARECGTRAVTLAEGVPSEERLLPVLTLGRVALELEDPELAAQLTGTLEPAADLRLFALHRALRGLRAEARGNLPVALAQYLDCGRVLERAGWLNPAIADWQVRAAFVQHRLGRTADAAATADECHERARTWGAPTMLGRTLRLRGTLTEGPRGVALLRQAVDILESGGNRFELAHALTALGKRLRRTSDAEGDRLLNRGRRLAVELQNAPSDIRSGMTARPVRAIVAGLTPAETKVAERAARGLSNREIATELGISMRAVERHLTSSYRKFGISGRDELARTLG